VLGVNVSKPFISNPAPFSVLAFIRVDAGVGSFANLIHDSFSIAAVRCNKAPKFNRINDVDCYGCVECVAGLFGELVAVHCVALFVVDGSKVAKNIDLSIFFFRMFVVYARTQSNKPRHSCRGLRVPSMLADYRGGIASFTLSSPYP
jgi:hypothetical protein